MPAGLVLYPTSVLLLLLMLPSRLDIVAAAWGILAVGDGAATLVGRRYGTEMAVERQKSIAGSRRSSSPAGRPAHSCVVVPPGRHSTAVCVVFDRRADRRRAGGRGRGDGVDQARRQPLRSADRRRRSVGSFARQRGARRRDDLALPAGCSIALPANTVVAWGGYIARTVSLSGAVVGAMIGTIMFLCAGWPGWLLLLAGFLCAAVTSRMGLQRKTLLGIAEERGGRRGAGNAIANTGIAAAAAVLAVVSYAHVRLVSSPSPRHRRQGRAIPSPARSARRGAAHVGDPSAPTRAARNVRRDVARGHRRRARRRGALGVFAIPRPHSSPALLPVVAGATAGSFVESLLAATFEAPGILNNDALNLINTAVAAFVAVSLAGRLL